ncbi:UNVERIFIED_CONTAM: hypothetical protein FKN15_072023 [Acipenser sinensis]
MGNSQCDYSPEMDSLYYTAESNGITPDASIDKMFLDYLGLNSSVVLQQHYETVQSSFDLQETQLKAYITEEKVSEIGNLVTEYLKRVQLHLDDPDLLADNTLHYEGLLSLQLTRVEKSILQDGHMNEKALKYWLNGAAVHSHMLIQLVRMGKIRKTAAVTASQLYNDQLPGLLNSYRDYRLKILDVGSTTGVCGSHYLFCATILGNIKFKNSIASHEISFKSCEMEAVKKSIVDQILESQQIRNAREFFKKTSENMDKLINQKGDFQISQSPLKKKRDDQIPRLLMATMQTPYN